MTLHIHQRDLDAEADAIVRGFYISFPTETLREMLDFGNEFRDKPEASALNAAITREIDRREKRSA